MAIKNVFFLVAVTCVLVSVNAQLPQFSFPFPFQPNPGMPGLPDITKCWSTVMNIPECVAEISQSILTGKFGNLGPACCKSFLDAEANCMPKLPFNPFFPPMLKEQCSKVVGAIPPTPK
ncbi:uncharacterized protein LOC110228902 [Arabidopsis lyrata subsp. lyrata]|uniref:uncharacterized protein LOC110228902 n=1 Tax=Arabidopsis lyrata subsp. lyrata TaxID=81972 RepID=UPI000A29AC2B|nr:uncharacterized protein LOC110228902 [Arabidopsis lyrata subsp. lyrata]|eukprot:XP_020882864.1 uncharacterized protein LOC110228902 [Arabidopsis lyrata subsp. lyrata]